MNFYAEASKVLDRLDKKEGSINSILNTVQKKDRKRAAALVIETLKCEPSAQLDLIF
jgi:25S rRNA (cytosine2278-C5)-methyltransferase